MMELAGGGEYTLFLTEPELDDRRLSEAFIRLFQRGLIERNEQGLELSKKGAFFRWIRSSRHSVLLRSEYPERRTCMVYVQKNQLWLAEIQDGSPYERYRLRVLAPEELEKWLIDTQSLPQPMLREEDTPELLGILGNRLEREEEDRVLAQLTKQDNDGAVLLEYTLLSGETGQLLQKTDGGDTSIRIYTQEAMCEMLRQCFGG